MFKGAIEDFYTGFCDIFKTIWEFVGMAVAVFLIFIVAYYVLVRKILKLFNEAGYAI